jgi:CheY-like chemotaxis protein
VLNTFGVLVVDDHQGTLDVVSRGLEARGIRVRTASSVLRALETLHDGSPRPALIITDLIMPRTNGWDFLKHLRREPLLRTLPIIVITGGEPGGVEGLADAVLLKPFDLSELADTVQSLVRERSESPG